MDRWERRSRKLAARLGRMAKHGRSLMTSVAQAEARREQGAKRRRANRRPGRRGR